MTQPTKPARTRQTGLRLYSAMLARILGYVRPYWNHAVGAVVFSTIVTLLGLLAPWPMKVLVDSVLGDRKSTRLNSSHT